MKMIIVIDDRIPRQEKKIGDKPIPGFVKLYSRSEINDFIKAVLNDQSPVLPNAKVIGVHRNILELKEDTAKKKIVEYCKKKKVPLIWFGGDYSSASSVEEGQVFICNASSFYESLFQITDIDGGYLPERLLFGQGYKASFLMCIRRLARHLIQAGELNKLEQTRKRFVQLGFKDLFQNIKKAEETDEKIAILNEAIENELCSL
jgi:hypothetical protein